MLKKIYFATLLVALLGVFAISAEADHSWGGYHWARTANPFTLQLGNNLSSTWQASLSTASSDWSASSVLNTAITSGRGGKNCSATTGRVEVCNRKYGNNGWLGLAQIWASGNHITKGVVKVNDTYFNTGTYNTTAWRNLVMCQEIGHTFGLDHQDENFNNANLNTCMDYTNNPTSNQHPNQHDYEQLVSIYGHLDSMTTVFDFTGDTGTGGNGKGKPANVGQDIDLDNPSAWGNAVRQDARGNNSLYERDLGRGEKLLTFVIWVQ